MKRYVTRRDICHLNISLKKSSTLSSKFGVPLIVFINDKYASDQYSQIHLSIICNSFGIIFEGIGQDRGSVSNIPQRQLKFFRYLNVMSSLYLLMTIKIHIKILKPMRLSSKHPLGSPPKQ